MAVGIRRRILVVLEDQSRRFQYSNALAARGYRVETAKGTVMALKLLKKLDFDMVITDINMPELDGVAFYKRAIWHYPHLKDNFLFVTEDEGDKFPAFSSLNRSLIKPFNIGLFLFMVQNMLEKYNKRAGWL